MRETETTRDAAGESSGEIARLLAVIEVQNELAATAPDVEEIMGVVATRGAELTRAEGGVVELVDAHEMVYRATSGSAAAHVGLRVSVDSCLSGRCVRERRPLRCDDAAEDPRVDQVAARAVGAVSMLCVPLHDEAGVRGALKVYAGRSHAFDAADEAVLTQLSRVVVAHMRRAEEFERKAFESRHDVLTDLGNRRGYEERMAKEVARAGRYAHPLSLALFDLDSFKAVNDEHGHPAGDEVLRRVGGALRQTRCADDCYRLGGDEFGLILPDTEEDDGRLVAERAAAAVAALNREHGVTTSWGVAGCVGGDWSDLHATADARLMARKGRRQAG